MLFVVNTFMYIEKRKYGSVKRVVFSPHYMVQLLVDVLIIFELCCLIYPYSIICLFFVCTPWLLKILNWQRKLDVCGLQMTTKFSYTHSWFQWKTFWELTL